MINQQNVYFVGVFWKHLWWENVSIYFHWTCKSSGVGLSNLLALDVVISEELSGYKYKDHLITDMKKVHIKIY
jgi:hypothetical protein